MRQLGPRVRSRHLESAIAHGARTAGMTGTRYRDQFNRVTLIATLERAVGAGIIERYIVKGGAAIEMRFGTRVKRATQSARFIPLRKVGDTGP